MQIIRRTLSKCHHQNFNIFFFSIYWPGRIKQKEKKYSFFFSTYICTVIHVHFQLVKYNSVGKNSVRVRAPMH
jgi:hypothetical protein